MGKAARQKKVFRKNAAVDRPIDENLRAQKIVPCIALLNSKNNNEILANLGAISQLVQDDNARHLLLREKLLHNILSNVLSSRELDIVAASLGILRDVVVFEGRDTALFLTRRKLSNVLESQISKFNELSQPDEISVQFLVNLFGLCSEILEHVASNQKQVAELAVKICSAQDSNDYPVQVYEEALRMLYLYSEEFNDVDINVLKFAHLKNLNSQIVSVYLHGVWFNTLISSSAVSEDNDKMLIECIDQLTQVMNGISHSSENTAIRLICLEILAIASQTNDKSMLNMLKERLFEQVFSLLDNREFRLVAVNVLNNLGWSLSEVDENWLNESVAISSKLFSILNSNEVDIHEVSALLGLLAASAAQNGSVLQDGKFAEFVGNLMQKIDQMYTSQKQGDSAAEDIESASWVELATALVNVLNVDPELTHSIGLVGSSRQLILSLLEFSNDVESQIAALNALFDIFGDNDAEYNEEEYIQSGMQEKLKTLKPLLKRSLKSSNEFKDQARESLLNLENYILYKEQ
ncbi:hypothetical protein DASB73_032150 [Starmerella bacillaris]|uniref:SYO1-like TPR repeats domain-containing protein n=1 Tax=Starmerella bacillaris TaxID=1247836 RepID=A0AAV5RMN8_STABA|nr:hypothetical protein DASB73_032150 [Starmerella bacillaris]